MYELQILVPVATGTAGKLLPRRGIPRRTFVREEHGRSKAGRGHSAQIALSDRLDSVVQAAFKRIQGAYSCFR